MKAVFGGLFRSWTGFGLGLGFPGAAVIVGPGVCLPHRGRVMARA